MSAFHYAFKVKDLESTRQFYVEILNCKEGRSTENWVDFDFFGFVRLRHDRHRAGAGVYSALGFGLRHALHAVAA